MRFQIEPLTAWTDPEMPTRTRAFFRAGWTHTLELLGREAGWLGADLIVVQVDVAEGDIRRRDGMPKANARVGHPGVVVSFESDHGSLRYATDKFTSWQDNVRGIALSLQALRAIDRYGVTRRAEQYVGFRALPAPAAEFTSVDEAVWWMQEKARSHGLDVSTYPPPKVYRFLARRFHPDAGGLAEDWERLDQARQLLEEARLL